MLGNDIVDLRDAESRPESFRPRFDERVFTHEERRAIARDQRPLIRRWAHWAAKEAAFKLGKQLDPEFVFAPGRLQVRFDSGARGTGRRPEKRGVVEWIGASERTPLGMIEVRSLGSTVLSRRPRRPTDRGELEQHCAIHPPLRKVRSGLQW